MSFLLKPALEALTVPALKQLAGLLPGSASGRKAELIDGIVSALIGGGIKTLWAQLDETQRAAVAECAHDPEGTFDPVRFYARYGANPAFSIPETKPRGYDSGTPTALCLFLHYDPENRCRRIPEEVARAVLAFVPKPAPMAIASCESLPEDTDYVVYLGEHAAPSEALVVMQLLESERIQVSEKTALPGVASLRILSERLPGGDYYPWVPKADRWSQEIGPIRAFAWPLLLQASGFATRTGTRLTLTPAGVKALKGSPADLLRGIWRKWLNTSLIDEFSRVDDIKGQASAGRVMAAVAPRRAAINKGLAQCPVGRWVSADDFSRYLCAAGYGFEVARDPWKLYICSRDYGSLGYEGSCGWNMLQERYLFALLFEYAATLGIVDVAYIAPEGARNDFRHAWGTDELAYLSRYDGLCYIRLTALGAYILGVTDSYVPSVVKTDLRLSVLPSLQIRATHGTPSVQEALLIERWAEAVAPDTWMLDPVRTVASIEKGFDIGELADFLKRFDDTPLPERVENFIAAAERNGRALKVTGSATLVECRDAATAKAIAGHKETAALCFAAGPKVLVVRNEHLETFRTRVRLLGFGLSA